MVDDEPERLSFHTPADEDPALLFPPMKAGDRVIIWIGSPDDLDALFFVGRVEDRDDELGDPVVDIEWPRRRASIWRRICESVGIHF